MAEAKLFKPLDEIIQEKTRKNARGGARQGGVRGGGRAATVVRGGGGTVVRGRGGFVARAAGRPAGRGGSGNAGVRRGAPAAGGRFRQESSARRDGAGSKPYRRMPPGDPEGTWKHDMYQGDAPSKKSINTRSSAASKVVRGGKAIFSGLDFDLTEGELKKIVAEYGVPEKAEILYDRAGRPTGKAVVVFSRAVEAKAAAEDLDQAEVNGHVITVSYEAGGSTASGGRGAVKSIVTRPSDPVASARPRGKSHASAGLFARATQGILSR